jgi:hypothetical protein
LQISFLEPKSTRIFFLGSDSILTTEPEKGTPRLFISKMRTPQEKIRSPKNEQQLD